MLLLTAAAFCQFLIFANAILYPKLGKYVGKLTYEMSYKNTKVALKAIEKINTGLFKMDCELALEKVVSDGYDDGTKKSTDPIVDIYIYTIGLSRPRVEVLEEMRDEMQQCKTYAIEKINKYFNANLTENPTHNFYHKRHRDSDYPEMSPVEFSPNYKRGNPRDDDEVAIIDRTNHHKNHTSRSVEEESNQENISYMENLMKKIKESMKQKENKTAEEKPHCKGAECKMRYNTKVRSSGNETEVVDAKEESENEEQEKEESENEEHEKTNEEKTKRHGKTSRNLKSSEKRRSQGGTKETAKKRHNKNESTTEEEIVTRSNATSKRSSEKAADKENQRKKEKQ